MSTVYPLFVCERILNFKVFGSSSCMSADKLRDVLQLAGFLRTLRYSWCFIGSTVTSLYPGLETVASLYPGLETVASLYPGLETVTSLYPGLETVASLYPGLETVASLYPGLETVASFYPGLETVASLYPGLERKACQAGHKATLVHTSSVMWAKCSNRDTPCLMEHLVPDILSPKVKMDANYLL